MKIFYIAATDFLYKPNIDFAVEEMNVGSVPGKIEVRERGSEMGDFSNINKNPQIL